MSMQVFVSGKKILFAKYPFKNPCYFSLVRMTASSHMIAELQKRSHKKTKGEVMGRRLQGLTHGLHHGTR